MSKIVQKAVAIKTSAGATATAVFAKPLQAGNTIVVAFMAVDHGGAVGSDSMFASSYASITDT